MRKYSKFRMISASFMVCVRLSLFPYCRTLSAQQSYFYFSPVYWVHLSCFCNKRSVVLYCRTPSMIICHFGEVLFYTLKERRCVYVVEIVYIIHSQPHPCRHYEQIIQIFHPRHPVLMHLSSPRQVYSTEKLRSRKRHFSRYFHNSTNRSKVTLIFTGDSVLNRTLAE